MKSDSSRLASVPLTFFPHLRVPVGFQLIYCAYFIHRVVVNDYLIVGLINIIEPLVFGLFDVVTSWSLIKLSIGEGEIAKYIFIGMCISGRDKIPVKS